MAEEKITIEFELDQSGLRNGLRELRSIIKSELGSAATAINQIKEALIGVGTQASSTSESVSGLVGKFNDFYMLTSVSEAG